MARMFQRVLSLPWWLRYPIYTVIVFALMAGPSIVTKLINPSTHVEFLLYSIYALVLVILLSALVGALMGIIASDHVISAAKESVAETVRKFHSEAENIANIQAEATKQFEILRQQVRALDDEIARAQEIVKVALGKFEASIVNYTKLVEIEGSVEKGGEIWVLTSALELEGDELRETIRRNLDNGVQYTYLIPDDTRLKKKMQDLANEWQKYCTNSPKEQIRCILVPKHFAYMTVVIYNPFKEPTTVLVKFPKSEIYPKRTYPFIYKVDDKPKEAWNTFVECVLELIENKDGQCPNVKPFELNFVEA